jgi:SOS response associated peptidase (SRAP)
MIRSLVTILIGLKAEIRRHRTAQNFAIAVTAVLPWLKYRLSRLSARLLICLERAKGFKPSTPTLAKSAWHPCTRSASGAGVLAGRAARSGGRPIFSAIDAPIGRESDRPGRNHFRDRLSPAALYLPVDGFFEWKAIKGQKAKQPYAIAMKDGRPFGFGGLWEDWKEPASGEQVGTRRVARSYAPNRSR